MKELEFKKQYARMVEIYGAKSAGHAREWRRQFEKLDVDQFEKEVSMVIEHYKPYGQDRWPTPGDFNAIASEIREPIDLEYPKSKK